MKNLVRIILLICALVQVLARPEAPKTRYGPPPAPVPHDQYGPPPPPSAPQREYLPPAEVVSAPAKDYLPPALTVAKDFGFRSSPHPAQPLPIYGPPAPFYGPPSIAESALITKNIYVHVPPEEPEVYQASAPIQTSVPKTHYKIIFIKAPNPPTPVRQVLPAPVQDEHKTLVYVLVKKPEEQQPLVLPSPAPTEPSKPEVYFIKYKQRQQQPATEYGPPQPQSAPAAEYGPPSSVESF